MAGTIVVDRIESDASYASNINVASQITFSNTVNFGITSVAPVAGFYSPSTNNVAFTTASTERMRIASDGKVGIGTSSPNANFQVNGGIQVTGTPTIGSTGVGVEIGYGLVNASEGAIQAYNRSGSAWINMAYSALAHKFLANNSEAMRIDSSGNLFVDCTTTPNGSTRRGFQVVPNTGINDTTKILIATTTASTRALAEFNNANGNVGSIAVSGSSTSYATSSDYRLKENITPMTGALAKVALLKPVTYKWKVDGSDGEGFIAHELAEVKPDCVSGDKDAVDEEGNPKYQGIDVSFLVATLTAAIQELKAINDTQAETITALTARVVALES